MLKFNIVRKYYKKLDYTYRVGGYHLIGQEKYYFQKS